MKVQQNILLSTETFEEHLMIVGLCCMWISISDMSLIIFLCTCSSRHVRHKQSHALYPAVLVSAIMQELARTSSQCGNICPKIHAFLKCQQQELIFSPN